MPASDPSLRIASPVAVNFNRPSRYSPSILSESRGTLTSAAVRLPVTLLPSTTSVRRFVRLPIVNTHGPSIAPASDCDPAGGAAWVRGLSLAATSCIAPAIAARRARSRTMGALSILGVGTDDLLRTKNTSRAQQCHDGYPGTY